MGFFSKSKKDKGSPAKGGGYPTQSSGGYPTQQQQPFQQQPIQQQPIPQQQMPGAPPVYTQPGAPPQMYPQMPPPQQYPGQQQPYPGQQQPYPGQPYPGQPPPPVMGGIQAQPTPQNVTNQYQVRMQPVAAPQGSFDAGARFDGNSQARIPPPPPGAQMNQAQMAAATGQGTQVKQDKAGFLSGGKGGGYSMMGGGLF